MSKEKHKGLIYGMVNNINPYVQQVNDTFITFVLKRTMKSLDAFKQATADLVDNLESELEWYYDKQEELDSSEINELEEFQYLPQMNETLEIQSKVLKILNDEHETVEEAVEALKKDNLIKFPTPED